MTTTVDEHDTDTYPRVRVVEREMPTPAEMAQWSEAEMQWWLLGPFPGEVPGLIRRIRRILDVSQRGLAALLQVSQSVVARWETGRTSPRTAVVMHLLRLTRITLTLHDHDTGELVEPMRDDGARTRAGSRFPAHTDLVVAGWWIPRRLRAWTSAEALTWEQRSRQTKDVAIGYIISQPWKRIRRELYGTPIDHPAHHQLVAQMEHHDERHHARREEQQNEQRRRLHAA